MIPICCNEVSIAIDLPFRKIYIEAYIETRNYLPIFRVFPIYGFYGI